MRIGSLARCAGVAAALALSGTGSQAFAIASVSWIFTGNCVDCAAAAGTAGYGVSLTYTVPVSTVAFPVPKLEYSGSNLMLALTWDNTVVDSAYGFTAFSAPASETGIEFTTYLPVGGGGNPSPVAGRFRSHADGSWMICVSTDCLSTLGSDYGTAGTGSWGTVFTGTLGPTGGSTVPEPAPLALVGAAAGLFALSRRRSTA